MRSLPQLCRVAGGCAAGSRGAAGGPALLEHARCMLARLSGPVLGGGVRAALLRAGAAASGALQMRVAVQAWPAPRRRRLPGRPRSARWCPTQVMHQSEQIELLYTQARPHVAPRCIACMRGCLAGAARSYHVLCAPVRRMQLQRG